MKVSKKQVGANLENKRPFGGLAAEWAKTIINSPVCRNSYFSAEKQ